MQAINSDLEDCTYPKAITQAFSSRIPMPALNAASQWLGLREIERLYKEIGRTAKPADFHLKILDKLKVGYRLSRADISRIPPKGPLLVVANHPFAAIEGLILGAVIRSVRPELKILAKSILEPLVELRELFLFVDPFGGSGAKLRNLRPLRQAIRWMNQGGALAVFPAGKVSHIRWMRWAPIDPDWHESVAGIARQAQAFVLPVFFEGVNGALFQTLGLVHPVLRTAMLAREVLNKVNRVVELHIGSPIPPANFSASDSNREMVGLLRDRTYALRHRTNGSGGEVRMPLASPKQQPIAPAQPGEVLMREVSSLLDNRVLYERRDVKAAWALADEIPALLAEIGRQREVAFRKIGEGTGRSSDLDSFDRYYRHIFLWNRTNSELIGAYRLGRSDEIVRSLAPVGSM